MSYLYNMFRRLSVYLVLVSLVLHGAARLGLLDIVYQQRHAIAYQLGLISELPIAVCSGNYDFDAGLAIQQDDQDESGRPVSFQVREMTLFITYEEISLLSHNCAELSAQRCGYVTMLYDCPNRAIFQPPKL